MKKTISIILTAILLLTAFVGCAAKNPYAGKTYTGTGKLTMAGLDDFDNDIKIVFNNDGSAAEYTINIAAMGDFTFAATYTEADGVVTFEFGDPISEAATGTPDAKYIFPASFTLNEDGTLTVVTAE